MNKEESNNNKEQGNKINANRKTGRGGRSKNQKSGLMWKIRKI